MSACTKFSRWAAPTLALALLAVMAAPLMAQIPRPGGGRQNPLPLRSARTAEFTATEGTWISLDVSPDGQTIVFDLLGDLYTMPTTGGKASPLLVGMAYEVQPRFSPDGESVVFVSDRSGGDNVWTMRLDRTDTTQVTRGNNNLYLSPEWEPGGEYVVASRSSGLGGPAQLIMVNAERGSSVSLGGIAAGKNIGAAFSPDGRYMWYARSFSDWTYNATLPLYQLYRYDFERATTSVMTSRYGSAMRPAVSPDGQWLVYASRHGPETGLRKRNLETEEEEWLAYPVQRDEQESRAPLDVHPGYSFMPDGSAIVVSYGGKIWNVPMDGSEPAEIPLEVEVELAIGPEVKFDFQIDTAEMVTASQIRTPVASPDGDRMVFVAFDRLWVKDMPDGDPERLTDADAGEFHPQWSPDGQWIAYVTWDDSEGGHIMKVPASGGGPTRLTASAAAFSNVAWAPGGDRIVATRSAAGDLLATSGLFAGPLGGAFVWVPSDATEPVEPEVISPTGIRDVMHFVQDEPDRIYAYSPLEGLVSFRWDGTDVKSHLLVRGTVGAGGISDPHPEQWEYLPRRVFPWRKGPDPTDPFVEPADPNPTDPDQDPPAEPGFPQPAGLVILSPQGDQAFAQIGRDIYVVDLPDAGSQPASLIASPGASRRLTQVGGEFPSWAADGSTVHWALGNVLFSYDLDYVEAEEAEIKEIRHARALIRARAIAVTDTLKEKRAEADSLEKADEEVPDSLEAEIARLAGDSVQVVADSLMARADSLQKAAEEFAEKASAIRDGDKEILADSTESYEAKERKIEAMLPRDIPRGTVALTGGRIITMTDTPGDTTGTPLVIEGGVVVVTDNRIVDVGVADSVEIPDSAVVIDVSGKTLVPGFVDTHYHAQWLVAEIHPEEVWQYLSTLSYGVTTTRDPQTAVTDILSYTDRVRIGEMTGPRIYSTGPGVFSSEPIRDADHAKTILRRYSQYFDTKTLKMYMTGNRQQRQWIIQAARELRLMPTTEGGLDFKVDMTHAVDGYSGVEHNLPIAPMYTDVVELFKESGTTNSPTLLVSYGGPFGENFFYATENAHDDEKLNVFAPSDYLDARTRRRGAWRRGQSGGGRLVPGGGARLPPPCRIREEDARRRRPHGRGKPRATAGPGVPLGAVGHGLRRRVELRHPARGDDPRRGSDRVRSPARHHREGQVRRHRDPQLQPARRAPQHGGHPLRDEDGRLYDGMTLNEVYPAARAFERKGPVEGSAGDAPAGIGKAGIGGR